MTALCPTFAVTLVTQQNQPPINQCQANPATIPFCSHKVSLRPLLRCLNKQETTALFKTLESVEREEFVAFLYRQGLAQLWLEFLLAQDSLPNAFEAIIASLKQDAINTAAKTMQKLGQ